MMMQAEHMWIGLKIRTVGSPYNDQDHWLDSTPLVYTNWDEGQPSRGVNEGCTEMFSGKGYSWHGNDCTLWLKSMCKRKVGALPPPAYACAIRGCQAPIDSTKPCQCSPDCVT